MYAACIRHIRQYSWWHGEGSSGKSIGIWAGVTLNRKLDPGPQNKVAFCKLEGGCFVKWEAVQLKGGERIRRCSWTKLCATTSSNRVVPLNNWIEASEGQGRGHKKPDQYRTMWMMKLKTHIIILFLFKNVICFRTVLESVIAWIQAFWHHLHTYIYILFVVRWEGSLLMAVQDVPNCHRPKGARKKHLVWPQSVNLSAICTFKKKQGVELMNSLGNQHFGKLWNHERSPCHEGSR